jgi:hypothetical protein
MSETLRRSERRSHAELFLPYALPYLAYVGIASLPAAWLSREAGYALRLLATGAALAWAWRFYAPLRGPRAPAGSVAVGCAAGLLGLGLWIALLRPLAPAGGEPWAGAAWTLRALAATALVPVFEELFMRGYLLRFALCWDRAWRRGAADPFGEAAHERGPGDVEPGAWSAPALLASTAIFALGHAPAEYPAALAYGAFMCALWIARGDLIAPIAAHATTNGLLALYVRGAGAWSLW